MSTSSTTFPQYGWKLSRSVALASLRSVRKLYDPRGIPSETNQRALIQSQRERYKIAREVKPDEVFDLSVARGLIAR